MTALAAILLIVAWNIADRIANDTQFVRTRCCFT